MTPTPYQESLDRLARKTAVGSVFRTAEWQEIVPAKIRERSLWSAGVAKAATIQEMKNRLQQGLELSRPGGTGMNRARFISDLREILGAPAGDTGRLTDINSFRRLGLIWDFQQQDAFEEGRWRMGMEPALLEEFPAQRLVRVEDRVNVRDWWALWGSAGAAVGWVGASREQMVALKTSPIWEALSEFGRPRPPFRWGSGMGLDDVDRAEAEQLGLIAPGAPAPDGAAFVRAYDEKLGASVANLDAQTRAWLEQHLRTELGSVSIDGDRIIREEDPGP